jgi:hypothetical protein
MDVEKVSSSLRWRLKTVIAWCKGLKRRLTKAARCLGWSAVEGVLKTAPKVAVFGGFPHKSLYP